MRVARVSVITTCLIYLMLAAGFVRTVGARETDSGLFIQEVAQTGLRTETLDTPHGRIQMRLPADIRAGDTISGTVIADRVVNAAPLSGYVLDIDGNKTPISNKLFKFVVPAAASSMKMILRDGSATEVGRVTIPIQSTMSAPRSNFLLPPFGQNGRPIEITGPFDGDMSNTRCVVSEKPVEIIAESPRKVVVQIPPEPIGQTNISVTERGKTTTGEFRNIGVNLSAPKTELTKGEITTLTVQVTGLQGLRQDVSMDLVTTGSVNMQGGNTQQITIKPNEVKPDGVVTLTRTLTGVQTGTFNVTATVIVPRM